MTHPAYMSPIYAPPPDYSRPYNGDVSATVDVDSNGQIWVTVSGGTDPYINDLLINGAIATDVQANFARRGHGRGVQGGVSVSTGPGGTAVSFGVSVGSGGGGATLRDLGEILARLVNQKAQQVRDMVAALTAESLPGEFLKAQVEVQILAVMMNAFKTALDSYGQAYNTAAGKGGAVG